MKLQMASSSVNLTISIFICSPPQSTTMYFSPGSNALKKMPSTPPTLLSASSLQKMAADSGSRASINWSFGIPA